MTTLSQSARQLRIYRKSPSMWARHKLRIDLARYRPREDVEAWLSSQGDLSHEWLRSKLETDGFILDEARSYQAEALDAMADPGRVRDGALSGGRYAMQWANGTAKTATAAILAHWFLDCYPGGKLLTSAGTWSQLKEQLWREIAHWGSLTMMPIAADGAAEGIGKTQIDIAPDWAAIARAADNPDTFEGVHGRYAMVILDEAKAIPQDIFDAVRRILRGAPDCMFWFVCLSSPGSPVGPFWEITNGDQAHRWKTFRCSAYQSERVTLEQVAEDAEDLGEDSPLFIAMVLGEFSTEGEETLIPLAHAQAAVGRVVSTTGPKSLGIDVARKGSDFTALVAMIGRQVQPPVTANGQRTTWTAGKALDMQRVLEFNRIAVDDSGVGGGVSDILVHAGKNVSEVNFGAKDLMKRPDIYVNNKTEMWMWVARELKAGYQDSLKPLGEQDPDVGLSLPEGQASKKLVAQLTSIQVHFDGTRYKVEGHRQLQTRRVGSPDEADAMVLANWARSRAGRSYPVEEVGRADASIEDVSFGESMLTEEF